MCVLLATVATALVGVRQHSENRRLEYRVWDAMRRRDELSKRTRELEAAIEEVLSPKRLLEEQDRRLGLVTLGEGEGAERAEHLEPEGAR